MRRFFFALASLLTLCLAAPLSACAAADALATGPPGGASVLGTLLGIGLAVGATITGSPRLDGRVYRPGQWESFLRAAREQGLAPRDLQRLADGGVVDLEGDDPSELLSSSGSGTNGGEKAGDGPDPLEGVDFTQASVREKAAEAGLEAADFDGYEASSDQGFTSGDVDAVVSGKDEE